MNHARLMLAGWLVLNLAGGTAVATAQERINGNHRRILETVVARGRRRADTQGRPRSLAAAAHAH